MISQYQAPPIEIAACVTDADKLPQAIQEIQTIDKVELHLHLGGAWPLEYLKSIADPASFAVLTATLDTIEQGMDYHQLFQVFDLVNRMVDSDQKVEDGVFALCKQLAEDRVTYVEIRTGLKDLGSGFQGYFDAILRGVARAKSEFSIEVGLILSLRRDSSRTYIEQTLSFIDQYSQNGVVGLDISGDSTKGDGAAVFEVLKERGGCPVPITLHLGESPQETAEQQLKELQLFNPARVGHAVHVHQEAWHWIRMHKVPLELCITSAVAAGMITKESDHPLLHALHNNHPVVICTDDPLIFKTSLSQECAKVAALLNLSTSDISTLQRVARQYIFGVQSIELHGAHEGEHTQKRA